MCSESTSPTVSGLSDGCVSFNPLTVGELLEMVSNCAVSLTFVD
jgi:hypothetical protein